MTLKQIIESLKKLDNAIEEKRPSFPDKVLSITVEFEDFNLTIKDKESSDD